MKTILLLEDLPEIRAWLKTLVMQVFPDGQISEAARVHDALELVSAHQVRPGAVRPGPARRLGRRLSSRSCARHRPRCQSVVVTIHDDDEHLFPALQAGAFGYILKEQPRELIIEQLQRISQGEPPLSPSIARRVIAYFAAQTKPQQPICLPHVSLTERENEVLLRVAKGFTLPEIGVQLGLSRHTIADYVKQIYRKLNVSSRAEAALEAQRLGLFQQVMRASNSLRSRRPDDRTTHRPAGRQDAAAAAGRRRRRRLRGRRADEHLLQPAGARRAGHAC